MGNAGSHRRRQGSRRNHPPQPEIISNNIVFAAATPYPTPNPNLNPNPNPNPIPIPIPNPTAGYYQYHPPAGYYPPPPTASGPMRMPLPAPYDQHHQVNWTGRPPCGPPLPPPPYVEHQKAVTIRNDVNLKKETIRVEPDDQNPGKCLVAFTFDATVAGSISVIYFAKEGEECKLTPTKENILPQVTIHFEQGLGQKFRQPSGTGIDFSMFEESELTKGDMDICPLAVKADACLPPKQSEMGSDDSPLPDSINSQITQVVFEKDKGEYKVKVLKQILWVNQMRYELQEIYGIGNSVEGELDDNDPGKECVICLSEPRDTTVLPCRHMCMCSGCAKVLRFQTNRCPICRQPVERLLEIKVSSGNEEEKRTTQSAE